MARYELWDTEGGARLGAFPDRIAALVEVRKSLDLGQEDRWAGIGLLRIGTTPDDDEVIAVGEDLVALARQMMPIEGLSRLEREASALAPIPQSTAEQSMLFFALDPFPTLWEHRLNQPTMPDTAMDYRAELRRQLLDSWHPHIDPEFYRHRQSSLSRPGRAELEEMAVTIYRLIVRSTDVFGLQRGLIVSGYRPEIVFIFERVGDYGTITVVSPNDALDANLTEAHWQFRGGVLVR